MLKNYLTIDVEDYYMVSAFADRVRFDAWHSYESRVERNSRMLLETLARHGVKATFFVLGWVAEQCPRLVKDIHAAGHEVASHGYNHRLIYDQTPDEFREDARRTKRILEDLTGSRVMGFRATSYSVIKETLWALDILLEEGYVYDSSIFPVHHDRYGMPEAPRFPHLIERAAGGITEFPPTTSRIFGQNIPVAGGGYLRLFPLAVTKAAIRRINGKERQSAIVYLHPWEIDEDQPRMQGSLLSRTRHYLNLSSTMPKLEGLLKTFSFQPLSFFFSRRSAPVHQDLFRRRPGAEAARA
jgi:polysaccharide deacetylase family protein (PEP-CTERM system associated)